MFIPVLVSVLPFVVRVCVQSSWHSLTRLSIPAPAGPIPAVSPVTAQPSCATAGAQKETRQVSMDVMALLCLISIHVSRHKVDCSLLSFKQLLPAVHLPWRLKKVQFLNLCGFP